MHIYWKVTGVGKDENGGDTGCPSRIGWVSSNYPDVYDESKLIHKWRTRNDDGQIGYKGVSNANSHFDPLDDLAMPDIGDVDIEWLEPNGKWEIL